jgi:hypothetical protein
MSTGSPLFRLFLFVIVPMSILSLGAAEPFVPNYDESLIPAYLLPDPLIANDGSPVKTAEEWSARRAELLALFSEHVYGNTPIGKPDGWRATLTKAPVPFLDGLATLEEVQIDLFGDPKQAQLHLLVIKPASAAAKPVPMFLAINFNGNHTVHESPQISLATCWVPGGKDDAEAGLVLDHRATEKGRGYKATRWSIRRMIESGVGLATFCYGDIDPDFDDGFANGIHAACGAPGEGEWGSIGAWAWGASRAMDWLVTDPQIDASRVAIMGHSRLGKTSLWAGAQDERFAMVISNNSGCGGAALNRRAVGETVGRITSSFPHWFTPRFTTYSTKEGDLPIDQHELISLIAPRLVYVASAVEDQWADPRGEFLAAQAAEPVYRLFGKTGLGLGVETASPTLNHPVGEWIRYHIREGKHDVTDYDWEQYIEALLSLPGA